MSWPEEFISSLSARSLSVEYRLEFLRFGYHVGRRVVINSSGNFPLKIDRGSVQISGTRIIPQRWNVSFGGFSLSLAGDIRYLTDKARKGQLAILSCRLQSSGPYQRIAIGSLSSIQGFRGSYQLTFRDLLSALTNSLDARAGTAFSDSDPAHFSMFYKEGRTTTVRTNWTVGDTTLDVVSDSIFSRKTGSRGIVKCTDSSNNEFYLFFTGTGTNSLTGVSSTTHPGGSASNLVVGNTVKAVAWLEGAPWDIFGSIITSTGTGTNGILDVFPLIWSIGGQISDSLWDYADSSRQVRVVMRDDGGIYEWGYVITGPLTNGIRYLTDLAATLGQWPVFRMGKLSWRACTDPTGIQTQKNIIVAAKIFDADIISINRHDFYNSDTQSIYRTTRIKYNEAGSGVFSGGSYNGNMVRSLPAQSLLERDGSALYLHDQSGSDNRASMATMDVKRLRGWDLYEGEKIVLRVQLRFCFLVAGDIVELTSGYLSGAFDPMGQYFQRRRLMVAACDYNIGAQNCSLTLVMISRRTFA